MISIVEHMSKILSAIEVVKTVSIKPRASMFVASDRTCFTTDAVAQEFKNKGQILLRFVTSHPK